MVVVAVVGVKQLQALQRIQVDLQLTREAPVALEEQGRKLTMLMLEVLVGQEAEKVTAEEVVVAEDLQVLEMNMAVAQVELELLGRFLYTSNDRGNKQKL